jgi:hypothetical protein
MRKIGVISPIILLVAAGWSSGFAQPDLHRSQIIEGVRIYRDAARPSLYFYEPGDLRLAQDEKGKPDFQFLDMRYTGHRSADDQGVNRFRSLLRFRVVIDPQSQPKLEKARGFIRTVTRNAELRPLPVRRLDAVLVCTAGLSDTLTMAGGHFERAEGDAPGEGGTSWKERTFVLKMDPHDAELLRGLFAKQQVAVSVSYAFYADCVSWDKDQVTLTGDAGAIAAAQQALLSSEGERSDSGKTVVRPVKVNAFQIVIDTGRWPDLLTRSDINEQLEPEYALLDCFCFDFANNTRPDLYEKKVLVEASGVGGKAVQTEVTFRSEAPDEYARSIRFPYAVRMDRPFRYKVVEITQNGEKVESSWIQRSSWTEIINVTSSASSSQPSSSDRITK